MNCFLNLSNLFGPSDIKCDLFCLHLALCVHVLNLIIGVITSLNNLCCCLLQDKLPRILKGQAVSDACANAQKNTTCWVSIIYLYIYIFPGVPTNVEPTDEPASCMGCFKVL